MADQTIEPSPRGTEHVKMHPFTKTDWYGFAGAGKNAVMSDETVTITLDHGVPAVGCLIMDDDGVALSLVVERNSLATDECIDVNMPFGTVPRAWFEAAVAQLPTEMTEATVRTLFPEWDSARYAFCDVCNNDQPLNHVHTLSEPALLFSRMVYANGETTPTDISHLIGGYEVGETLRIDVAAPGSGYTVYKITKIDEQGIWARVLRSTVCELTAADVI